MDAIRILTDKGSNSFNEYLLQLKRGIKEPPPLKELSSEPMSEKFRPTIEINRKHFETRYQMGQFLTDCFYDVKRNLLTSTPGLWSWLALYFFDSICPEDKKGNRKVRQIVRYVCSEDYRHYYRHYLAATWDVFSLYGKLSRMFLECPTSIHNDFMEQLASRQDLITNKGLIEAADMLYWDANKERPKKNATNRKILGNIRRFVLVYWQFDRTYDLHSMSAQEILDLLPDEFNGWKN